MLLAADREKLHGFQARCLRKIQKIPLAFISRVSNAEVRERSKAERLSTILLQRQLKYDGKLARDRSWTLPRQMVFQDGQAGEILPTSWNIRRNRGRPRVQWGHYMHACALNIAGGRSGSPTRSSEKLACAVVGCSGTVLQTYLAQCPLPLVVFPSPPPPLSPLACCLANAFSSAARH